MDTQKVVIDETARTLIIQNLVEKLKIYYIFPDVAEQLSTALQKHLDDKEYADITDGELFSKTLTEHIQEINHDKHLRVRWYPEPLPDDEASMHQNQEWLDDWREQAKLDNYGLYKVERLPGNVGYLDVRVFHSAAWGGDIAIAAMNFLSNTNVLIVDLRQCRGGEPGMVALVSSYLFGEEPVHLNSFYLRGDNVTQQSWTLPYVPGKRFSNKPVYILTSKDTFSGGEEFAYNLKTRQRATLIGETTRGGAHPGMSHRLHPHFDVFIPNGRPINPVTGTNWEGSGVVPDILAPQEGAFIVAYRMALESIIEDLREATTSPLRLLREEAQVALQNLEAK
jgi:hypothetical protein